MSAEEMKLDSLRIFQRRLDGIAAAMHNTLFRSAVSPVVRDGADAASALFSPSGELIALSPAIPLLLGALPDITMAICSRFAPETMVDGDLFWMNDPFSGGTHLPDIAVLCPVFDADQLLGFAASLLHHQDVGGMRAGSVPPDATEIHQEGLRLPPMLMGRNGSIGQTARTLIEGNSRVPDIVLADLDAQIGAAGRAAQALRVLARECGPEYGKLICGILAAGERSAAKAIAKLPHAPVSGYDRLDPAKGLPNVEVKVSLYRTGAQLNVDFTGSSPQVAAPINCVRSGPMSAAFYAMICLAGPDGFKNGGLMRNLSLTLPHSSIVNASYPAAVNARMGVVRCITSALLQTFSSALPQQMPAANSGMSFVLAFSGRHRSGKPFVATEIIAGGAGGGPQAPGAPGISTDVGNARSVPVEVLESLVPIRVLAAQIRKGSGGPGLFPGGDGITRRYLALADGIAVSIRGERFVHVPDGTAGGGAPLPAAATLERCDEAVEELSARSNVVLNAGDQLTIQSCGGAGWGAPPELKEPYNA